MDTALVIFNGCPPRFALRELRMALACPEKCFQAQSADECFVNIQWWLCKTRRSEQSRPQTMFDFISTFCKGDIEPLARDAIAHEAYINHFAIPSGKSNLAHVSEVHADLFMESTPRACFQYDFRTRRYFRSAVEVHPESTEELEGGMEPTSQYRSIKLPINLLV